MGQWSQGGMIMVGDMFNNALKYRVDSCATSWRAVREPEPAVAPRRIPVAEPGRPRLSCRAAAASGVSFRVVAGLGSASPSSTGAQNDIRYACFPPPPAGDPARRRRLASTTPQDHQISGFSQQQGRRRVADLHEPARAGPRRRPAVIGDGSHAPVRTQGQTAQVKPLPNASPSTDRAPAPLAPATATATSPATSVEDTFANIERLADLRDKRVITDQEFEAKKAELLTRL